MMGGVWKMADKPFDIREFEAFCRALGRRRYDGADGSICALAQFGFPDIDGDNRRHAGISAKVYRAATVGLWEFSALAGRLAGLE